MENAGANRPCGDGSNIFLPLQNDNPQPLPREDPAPQQYGDPAPLPQDDPQLVQQDDPTPQQHNGQQPRHKRAGKKRREALQHYNHMRNFVNLLYKMSNSSYSSRGGPRGRSGRGANNYVRGGEMGALYDALGLGRGAAARARGRARGAARNARGRGRGVARGSRGHGRGHHAE